MNETYEKLRFPDGWDRAWDSKNHCIYFIDHKNKITSWVDPRIKIYNAQKKQSMLFSNTDHDQGKKLKSQVTKISPAYGTPTDLYDKRPAGIDLYPSSSSSSSSSSTSSECSSDMTISPATSNNIISYSPVKVNTSTQDLHNVKKDKVQCTKDVIFMGPTDIDDTQPDEMIQDSAEVELSPSHSTSSKMISASPKKLNDTKKRTNYVSISNVNKIKENKVQSFKNILSSGLAKGVNTDLYTGHKDQFNSAITGITIAKIDDDAESDSSDLSEDEANDFEKYTNMQQFKNILNSRYAIGHNSEYYNGSNRDYLIKEFISTTGPNVELYNGPNVSLLYKPLVSNV